MNKYLQNIVHLIVKEKIDNLTKEEQTTLDNWKSESGNMTTYKEIVNQQNIDNRFELYDKINQQKSWKKLQIRIQPKTRRLFIQEASRWAAILVLPLICAYFIYNYYNNTNEFQRFIDKNINYDAKAVLILEDGNTYDLEKIKTTQLKVSDQVQAMNANNQLVYSVNKKKASNLQEKEISHTVKTSRNINGEYSIILSDGTKVWLNSETEFKYPIQFIGTKRKVYLKGEAQFEVAKDASKPFIVITEDMDIKVLGTFFNVKTYSSNKITQTTLIEGSIKINAADTEAILSPGQQAHFEEGQDLVIRKVNTALYTSWVKGLHAFNNTKLVDITDLLHHWYDVDVFYESELTKQIRFTGAMNKNNPIDELIKLIEKTSTVKFSIVENALIVSE
jgi:hypothetical protein